MPLSLTGATRRRLRAVNDRPAAGMTPAQFFVAELSRDLVRCAAFRRESMAIIAVS
ncbi:MAG: hypothetical protein ACREDV_03015 [Methylocella sp.]